MAVKKAKEGNSSASEGQFDLVAIKQALDTAENQLRIVRKLLFYDLYKEKANRLKVCEERVVEGVFDGESMLGADGKKYPVSPNYASKSKLVAGDILKLMIEEDGAFIFKQIGPIKRKRIVGQLKEQNESYYAHAEGKIYQLLPASVSYFKAKDGDKVTIIIPKDEESNWAAVENVIS